jgi:predicted hotdog family 3-hydroxylacyl-ACP dehydratase
MKLSKRDIAGLIPHAGAMCLLDGVEEWDDKTILCRATGHGDPAHPLRSDGRLRSLCGIEYAAQAAAVHAALAALPSGGLHPKGGVLASLREVALGVDRLDDIAAPLTIRVERLLAQEAGAQYRFAVAAEGRDLLQGRLSVAWVH